MQKGFIGAIGDDFPSLIPLFFGLLLFFSSMSYAFITINDRNDYISTYIDSLKIAKTALDNSTYSSYEDFESKVNLIVSNSNYIVGLQYFDESVLDNDGFSIYKIYEDNFISLENNKLSLKPTDEKIGTLDVGEKTFLKTSNSLIDFEEIDLVELSSQRDVFTYIYPVSLMTDKGFIVVYLLVVVY